MKPISSLITTAQSKADSATGTQHGERGLATPKSSDEVATWLAKQNPADMDKAAASRASSHGVGLRVRSEFRFPSGPNGERLPSYEVAVGCEVDGTPESISAALNDLRNFLTPAPMRKIEEWLARLSVVVARRREDEFAEELRVVEYASRLSRYPADVVKTVLLTDAHQYFPTWAELEKRCEALTGPRRQMVAALERGPEPKEAPRRPPTADERARIQALVDEMFPQVSQQWRDDAVAEALKGDCMKGDAA